MKSKRLWVTIIGLVMTSCIVIFAGMVIWQGVKHEVPYWENYSAWALMTAGMTLGTWMVRVYLEKETERPTTPGETYPQYLHFKAQESANRK